MKDDELEVWRRQWHGQPAVPIDLIRKVERETVYMRFALFTHILPLLIGLWMLVGAVTNPNAISILIAVGLWSFLIIGWSFGIQNMRGVWAPAAETTAAYVELSIVRCRSKLGQFRFANVMTPLLTTFILIGLYEGFLSSGMLWTGAAYVTVGLSFLWTIAVVSFVLIILARSRKKTVAELDYLLDLQRKLQNGRPAGQSSEC